MYSTVRMSWLPFSPVSGMVDTRRMFPAHLFRLHTSQRRNFPEPVTPHSTMPASKAGIRVYGNINFFSLGVRIAA